MKRLDSTSAVPLPQVALCLAAALVLIIGGLMFYRHDARALQTRRHAELQTVADLKIGQIVAWREKVVAAARLNAVAPVLRLTLERLQSVPDDRPAREDLRARLARIQESDDFVDALLTTPEGGLLVALDPRTTELDSAARDLVERAVTGRAALLGEIVRPDTAGPPHLDVAAPIPAAGHNLLAVLLLRSDPQHYLFPMIRSWPTPSQSAETLLVRRDKSDVLFLNAPRHRNGSDLKLRLPLSEPALPAAQALRGGTGSFEGVDYRGVKVLSDLRAVPGSTWFMVTKMDAEEIFAELQFRWSAMVALFALGVALTGLLVTLVYRHRQQGLYRKLHEAERLRREAREEFRATFYGIGDGVISADGDGRVTHMNPVAVRLTGWSEHAAVGRPLEEVFRIINENNRQVVENPAMRVLREGNTVGPANHTLLVSRDGAERPIADSGAPVRDDQGRVVGVVLVFRDQTAERAAEIALRESERRYRELFESNPHPMWVYDLESLGFLAVNDAAVSHYGYSRAEFLGMTIADIRPAEDLARLMHNVGELPEGFRKAGFWRHRKKNGEVIEVEITSHSFEFAGRRARLLLAADATERRRAEADLRASEERLRLALAAANQGLYDINFQTGTQTVSDEYARMLGYEPAAFTESLENWSERLHPDDRDAAVGKFNDYVCGRTSRYRSEFRQRTLDGQWKWILSQGKIMQRDEQGRPVRMLGTHTEITERKRVEEQLVQAQKMESVGRLAGGIAHDFNNMLGVIIGHCDLALDRGDADPPLQTDLGEIRKAAQRSADLTRQLLAFARKQTIRPKVLDINDKVGGMLTMLRRLIGEDIELIWKPGQALWPVKVDPVQLDQILANLAVNARDAISGAGMLSIATTNIVLDDGYSRTHAGFRAGAFVQLAVSDNGCGMTREVKEHLFTPFFTTKEVGKGTGLGLATVYGIVKQNEGFINVYSEAGHGTTITIYLPRVTSRQERAAAPPDRGQLKGDETILLVEDEEAVLSLGFNMLKRYGYSVLAARNGDEALELVRKHHGSLHLLLTDVVMPRMNGQELTARISALFPGIKTLFMSGYTAEVIGRQGLLSNNLNFLQKPFSADALAQKVRSVLEQK